MSKDSIVALKKRWYLKHREELLLKAKARYKTKREQINAYGKKWFHNRMKDEAFREAWRMRSKLNYKNNSKMMIKNMMHDQRKYLQQGLCPFCKEHRQLSSQWLCSFCLKEKHALHLKWEQHYLQQGLCPRCKEHRKLQSKSSCAICLERVRNRYKKKADI
jgi:hypothetical protein